MDSNDPTTDSNLTFEERVIEIIKHWLQGPGFHARKITDTPTDALQVVNRKYVNLNGTTSQRPSGPVLGQQYFDTTLGYPIFWDGASWVTGASSSPSTVEKSADYVVPTSENGYTYFSTKSSLCVFTLPAAALNLVYRFVNYNTNGIKALCTNSNTIRFGAVISSANGYCSTTVVGDTFEIVAVGPTGNINWWMRAVSGTFSIA